MNPEVLQFVERPAASEPQGLLVLHHGRGSEERDLLQLGDVLDPNRRLHAVAPRAPLTLPGSPGFHWYLVPRVGHPDHGTFWKAFDLLAAFHQETWERTGIAPERTVLGGFSMGAVMSLSLGLAPTRPPVAGIMGFSGFLPVVDGWSADTARHASTDVFVSHGRQDPVIGVDFGRGVREQLADRLPVEYAEFEGGHWIDPAHAERAAQWLAELMEPQHARNDP